MLTDLNQTLLNLTNASGIRRQEPIQDLWSGYGKIIKVLLEGSNIPSVIVKHVQLPRKQSHPRGWGTDRSHQRKLKSYQVETNWYKEYSARCDSYCRVAACLAIETAGDEVLLILEDLDAAGYARRRSSLAFEEMRPCLQWLANFHATFMGAEPGGLWPTGTYWHLETRPDELEALNDNELKEAATAIDTRLKQTPYQTLVHGDAKLANFCFSEDGRQVAAVDFQYVGRGCGMKDLAYFVGSCLNEVQSEEYEARILEQYFSFLREALARQSYQGDIDDLVRNWHGLYHMAWADFHRFLKGWSPSHYKINDYSERITREVIAGLST